MKKIKLIYTTIALTAIALVFNACDLQEANINPNNATEAPMKLILPAAQVNMLFGIANDAQTSSIWTQQLTGVLSDFQSLTTYQFLPLYSEFSWSNRMYSGAMVDLKALIEEAEGVGASHIAGVSKICMAICLGHIVDTYGDAPYSTALRKTDVATYDTGEELYSTIQSLLDDAIVDLTGESSASPSTWDLVYSQSLESDWVANSAPLWIKTANALKARYHNHLSKVDPAKSATDALAALAAGSYTSNEDDANMAFGPEQSGPWNSFLNGTFGQNNIALSNTFTNLLKDRVAPDVHDPRALFYFEDNDKDNDGGLFYGVNYGSFTKPPNVATVGSYLNTVDAATNIITYTEVKFIEAEANFRLGQFAPAAAAYNEAVKSSILRVTGAPDSTYEANFAVETATTIQTDGLKKIFTEKHIALFLEYENWVDWRRSIPAGETTVSGIPTLTPAIDNETNGAFPRRFLYPQSEVSNNAANLPSDLKKITDRIFWDL